MPNYNYFPVGYQPYYQQPYYQPQQIQTPQQTATQPPAQTSMIWVSGEREAQMYPVAPNNAVTLWSQTEPVVYLKQADATGKPTLKVYDLVERTQNASAASSAPGDKLPDYATKEDLSTVVGAVRGLASDIEQIKSDMYGIAGKKKTVKKTVEVTEDDE